MNEKIPTPRTDGQISYTLTYGPGMAVAATFARELERENHILRHQLKAAVQCIEDLACGTTEKK